MGTFLVAADNETSVLSLVALALVALEYLAIVGIVFVIALLLPSLL